MSEDGYISKSEAVKYLGITEKEFVNYHVLSGEIEGIKQGGRWRFDMASLARWKALRDERLILLSESEYEQCFQFAIRMVYGGLSLNGIRGQRTEVQAADDVILGILAEHGVKNFLKSKFSFAIELDEDVHPSTITPQDIHKIVDSGVARDPKLGVGIKASKMKNAFLVLGGNEVDLSGRVSDVYIFVRVGLPSDHIFRVLRDHSFFGDVRKQMEAEGGYKNIEELLEIPVWVCGFVYKDELEKVTSIPGQEFSNGHRYVKSVKFMRNTDDDWRELISKL